MADDMEDCPFCPDFHPFTASRKSKSGVYVGTAGCAMCGASIVGTADTHEGAVSAAIKAWNTRAERTCRNVAEEYNDMEFVCSECSYAVPFYQYGPEVGEHCKGCGMKLVE